MTKVRKMRIHRFGGPAVLQADDVELSLPDASQGADVVIDYKAKRFEDHASGLDLVFDLIDGDTRECALF